MPAVTLTCSIVVGICSVALSVVRSSAIPSHTNQAIDRSPERVRGGGQRRDDRKQAGHAHSQAQPAQRPGKGPGPQARDADHQHSQAAEELPRPYGWWRC